ncbi:MAG: hypothetical protein HOQ11_05025 [Gemmatimonadaceae bacterium]|nr:hypothetical protein [Gemmatimonadaceae bacterium]NUQ91390.1 hypothetical protein [Gemmatimonadaceae bacterium]NUR20066.1 hypothetical protein [Gemmatimonadaceae bacterium]NUS96755.1 hypothetical protein [Gemmatimonadaceae bacterium]
MIADLMSLHPSDETLSRIADQNDTDRMRSRAGRHAMRCTRCRGEIAELHALGEAARAVPVPDLPATLRERIAASDLASGESSSLAGLHAIGDHAAPARSPRRRRALVAFAAAAALTAIVLVWPSVQRSELAAADAERITMFPRYPRAGTTVRVRFVPRAGVRPTDTLWLEGDLRVVNDDGWDWQPVGVPIVREGDEYRGRLTLPNGALGGSLRLVEMHVPIAGDHSFGTLVVLTSDSADSQRPSLDALEAATARGVGPWQSRDRIAAEFVRWAPDHPMRWTLDRVNSSGGMLDWLGYFTSKERRFARLTATLDKRKTIRAGELAGMVTLAYQIEEPGLAAEWSERLLRAYPRSPWSVDARIAEIHAMELRGAPRDSILRLIPSLDTVLRSTRGIPDDHWTAQDLIARYEDSTAARRWRLRMAAAGRGVMPFDLTGRQTALADRELRDSAETGARRLLERLAGVGGPDAGRTRAFMYGQLGSIALARGEPRRVIALTDSSRIDSCRWLGRDTRALAYLALGDSASARDLLLPFAGGEWSGAAAAQRALGLDMTDPRVKQSADSAARAAMKCGR